MDNNLAIIEEQITKAAQLDAEHQWNAVRTDLVRGLHRLGSFFPTNGIHESGSAGVVPKYLQLTVLSEQAPDAKRSVGHVDCGKLLEEARTIFMADTVRFLVGQKTEALLSAISAK